MSVRLRLLLKCDYFVFSQNVSNLQQKFTRRKRGTCACVCVYLNSGFSQIDLECQLLSGVDVRVVRLRKNPLELLELRAGERGPDASLLPLLVESAVIREQFVGNCWMEEDALDGSVLWLCEGGGVDSIGIFWIKSG